MRVRLRDGPAIHIDLASHLPLAKPMPITRTKICAQIHRAGSIGECFAYKCVVAGLPVAQN